MHHASPQRNDAAARPASAEHEHIAHLASDCDTARIEDLTAQQHRVFDLLSEGLSNKEIARVLHLHESTVKVHVSAILAKLGCRNRTAAALVSLRHQLITAGLTGGSADVSEPKPSIRDMLA